MNKFIRNLFRSISPDTEDVDIIPHFGIAPETFAALFNGEEKASYCKFNGDEFTEVVILRSPAKERDFEGLIIGYDAEDSSEMICVKQSTGRIFITSVSLDGGYSFHELNMSFSEFISKCKNVTASFI